MSKVYEIADEYVLAYAALDPIAATDAGIAGHEHELTDYSPAGAEARDRLDRETLAALQRAPRAASRSTTSAPAGPTLLEPCLTASLASAA